MSPPDLSQFECLGCGACCRQNGYVRLKQDEPDIIASFLKMDVYLFIENYTRLTRDRQALSLIEKKNGECIFLTTEGCTINDAKPRQCLEFPFKWKFKDFNTICAWAKKNKTDPVAIDDYNPKISSPSSSSK